MTPTEMKTASQERVSLLVAGWCELDRAVAYQHLNALGQRIGGIEHTIERLAREDAAKVR